MAALLTARRRIVSPASVLLPGAAEAVRNYRGLRTWRVPHPRFGADDASSSGMLYDTWADVPAEWRDAGDAANAGISAASDVARDLAPLSDGTPADGPRIRQSMFPPAGDAADALLLDSVIRMVPTCNDKADHGGFFVAIIERIADDPATSSQSHRADAAPLPPGLASAVNPLPQTLDAIVSFFGIDGVLTADDETPLRVAKDSAISPPSVPSLRLAVTVRGAARATRKASGAASAMVAEPENEELLLCAVATAAGPVLKALSTEAHAECGGDSGSNGADGGSAGITLVGAGLPLFARMPAQCEWWPSTAPCAARLDCRVASPSVACG